MSEFFSPVTIREATSLSPVTLAFIGDAVYSLYVREGLVRTSDCSPAALQKYCSQKVSAHGQNALYLNIEGQLTEEESAIFRRGRNAKKPSHSKNAPIGEYNISTGLEAVFGWLYLTGQTDRLLHLMEAAE